MVGDGLDQSFVDIYKLPGNEYCRNVIEIRGISPLDVRQLREVSRCSVFAAAFLRKPAYRTAIRSGSIAI
jgi:hypothetical protein